MNTITTGELSAYMDGALTPERAKEIDAALAGDAVLRTKLERLRAVDAALREAYAGPLREPVPQHLLARVDAAFAARQARKRPALRRHALPIAAGILAALCGYGAAELVFRGRIEHAVAMALDREHREQRMIERFVSVALERQPSGEAHAWSDPDSGVKGTVTPVRTYQSKSGDWCREYRLRYESGARKDAARAVACRVGVEEWITVVRYYFDV